MKLISSIPPYERSIKHQTTKRSPNKVITSEQHQNGRDSATDPTQGRQKDSEAVSVFLVRRKESVDRRMDLRSDDLIWKGHRHAALGSILSR
ncbi:unnamed protein product, partial [Iphiclides podalirius]